MVNDCESGKFSKKQITLTKKERLVKFVGTEEKCPWCFKLALLNSISCNLDNVVNGYYICECGKELGITVFGKHYVEWYKEVFGNKEETTLGKDF